MEIHPKLRSWVQENIRIGEDLALLKMKLVEKGHNPAIVDQIVAELQAAEQEDKFPDYVVQWLKYSESQGDRIDYIREKLRGHGYSEAEIDYLLRKHVIPARQQKADHIQKERKKHSLAQWVIAAAILVVIALIVIFVVKMPGHTATTTTITTTSTTATTLGIAENPLLSVKIDSPEHTSLAFVRQDKGIKLDTNTVMYYNASFGPGRYRIDVIARADRAPNLNAYIKKADAGNLTNALLKKYRSDAAQDFLFLDVFNKTAYGWPHLIISTDDMLLASLEIDSADWKTFAFDVSLDKPSARLWLYFLDDSSTRGTNGTIIADRSIYLGEINFYGG